MAFTWTAPKTWIATDTPTVGQLNDISEDLRFLRTKDKAHVYRTTNENLLDATWEVLNWTAESYDNNSMHNNAADTGRLSCQSDGLYFVEFKCNFDVNTTGVRKIMMRLNSGASDVGGTHLGTWNEDGIASNQTTVAGGRGVVMATGGTNDYVELFGYQDSGAPLDIISGAATSFAQIIQITG